MQQLCANRVRSPNGALLRRMSSLRVSRLVTKSAFSVDTVQDTAVTAEERLEELLERERRLAFEKGYQEGLKAAKLTATADGQQPTQQLTKESVKRTAVKGLTWRIVSTGCTILLAMTLLPSVEAEGALELGVVEFVSKYGLYFIHERLWAAIPFLL